MADAQVNAMLCPDCKTAAPGGAPCPSCGQTVPERETFAGQGGRYLLVLFGLSLVLLTLSLLGREIGFGGLALDRLFATRWIWIYVALVATPLVVGLYYWFALREEEVVVTDEGISRHSRWGDEHLAWAAVTGFRHRSLPLRQTRLGRVTWFSRFFPAARRDPERIVNWHGSTYELLGPPGEDGEPAVMRLEPGTIDDLAWLLALVEERIGPPQED